MDIPGKETLIDSTKGVTAIAEADEIYEKIAAYLGDDIDAMREMREPAAFFKKGVDFIGGDLDVPLANIVMAQPDYVNDIESQWATGISVLEKYSQESGQPIPQDIIAWKDSAEAGWKVAQNAAEVQEKVEKAVTLFKMVRPFARFA